MKCLLFALILILGCSEKPGQSRAVEIVWRDVFKVSTWQPPAIQWVEGDGCDKADAAFKYPDGICKYGLFNDAWVIVAWSWKGKIADSELAHELMHATLFYETGDPDSGHLHNDYDWLGAVPRAVRRLQQEGL